MADKAKVIRTWEYMLKEDRGKLSKGMRELIEETLKCLKVK
ncbi:hypothetical protein ES708_16542 [subsurface metagenome]